jgi:hypothetical protein
MEPSEREIVIRTDNASEVWHVYIVKGATGEGAILKQLQNKTEDEHGYRGTLPKRGGIRFGKVKRVLTDEQRRQMSERMKERYAKPIPETSTELPLEFSEP